RAKCFRKC
ncbi:glycosyl hydrolases 31 family protein, partial [Vibrio parahaemolyticus V-223/04]